MSDLNYKQNFNEKRLVKLLGGNYFARNKISASFGIYFVLIYFVLDN